MEVPVVIQVLLTEIHIVKAKAHLVKVPNIVEVPVVKVTLVEVPKAKVQIVMVPSIVKVPVVIVKVQIVMVPNIVKAPVVIVKVPVVEATVVSETNFLNGFTGQSGERGMLRKFVSVLKSKEKVNNWDHS